MKKMAKTLVLGSLLLIMAAVSVAAEEKADKKKRPAKDGQRNMANFLKKHPEVDQNKDGKISKEESEAFRKTMAEKRTKMLLKSHPEADLNKDGKLSREEMASFRKANAKKRPADKIGDKSGVLNEKHMQQMLKKHPEADLNKDGKLDLKEIEALKEKFMNTPIPEKRAKKLIDENPAMDANKDGKLTRGEISQWQRTKKAGKGDKAGKIDKADKSDKAGKSDKADKSDKAGKGSEKSKGKNRKKAEGPSEKQLAGMLKKMPEADADKDGKLTAEEAKAYRKSKRAETMAKQHPEADKNKDGKLCDEEMKELRKKLKEDQKSKNADGKKDNKGKGKK